MVYVTDLNDGRPREAKCYITKACRAVFFESSHRHLELLKCPQLGDVLVPG